MNYWQKLQAVDVITEQMLSGPASPQQQKLIDSLRTSTRYSSDESQKKGWRAQGIKMFKRRFYEQSVKCFEHSGDDQLRLRAVAYGLAEEASKVQSEADALQYRVKETQMTKPERRKLKEEIAVLHARATSLFKQAAI